MELAVLTPPDSGKNLPDRKSSIGMAEYQNFLFADSVLYSYILAPLDSRHFPIDHMLPVEDVSLTEYYSYLSAVVQTDWYLAA